MKTSRLLYLGIMCDGPTFKAWQTRCLKNLLVLDFVEIRLLIINDNVDNRSISHKMKIFLTDLNHVLYYFCQRFISKPSTGRRVDMSDLFARVPSIRCKTIRKGRFSQYFSRPDVKTIQGYDLDIILRFGEFGIIRGDILNIARYGIWSFHAADEQKYRGLAPLFWEAYYEEKKMGAILQKITESLDAGVVLKKGFLPMQKYSYTKNIEKIYNEISKWPAQVCKDIYNGHADYLNASPSNTKAPIYHRPNNIQMLAFTVKMLRSWADTVWKAFFRREK